MHPIPRGNALSQALAALTEWIFEMNGIVSHYKHNGKHKTNLVGRMLEIKCPVSRKINTTGSVRGVICPVYYWDQVQIQLETCDLDECDFWQCKIIEYENREAFIKDTDGKEPFRSKQFQNEKGCLIQLMPKRLPSEAKNKKNDELIYEYAKFIRPSELARDCRAAGLEWKQSRGMQYNPLTRRYWMSQDTSVNYLVATQRPF